MTRIALRWVFAWYQLNYQMEVRMPIYDVRKIYGCDWSWFISEDYKLAEQTIPLGLRVTLRDTIWTFWSCYVQLYMRAFCAFCRFYNFSRIVCDLKIFRKVTDESHPLKVLMRNVLEYAMLHSAKLTCVNHGRSLVFIYIKAWHLLPKIKCGQDKDIMLLM